MYKRIQSIQVICRFLFLLDGETHGLNLSLGMFIRLEFMFLSMVTPSPNTLGWNIDVCLHSLIDEFKQL